ncbi:MAG: hypothetical protein HC849_24460 [Oscillatoriales cyanobacterium RU_3_3]|nr:hypothetical protein [Microcoleus sp. SU_5_6]NJM62636.1 hypothetical protein [Oscillatoriales cyanobacterium RU_3_3]NJR22440.1 hypothetical protein [Richelia sp. CSU_2_1]
MADIRKILSQLAVREGQLLDTQFLAPCVRGGKVRTRISSMIYTFQPQPRKFEGWAIFQPVNDKIAAVIEEPSLPQLTEYLQLLIPVRLLLAFPLKGQTWLAYPVNESDAKQRTGSAKPVPVHLVTEGSQFEQIVARWDGYAWWFEEIDRRADPLPAEELKTALKKLILPESVRFKGMTPEMRSTYELVCRNIPDFDPKMRDEKRLQAALKMGGGELREFRDRADYWLVEWTSSAGEHHSSAIAKSDLTVIGAGICLSGFDRNFDLQSLVGVVEDR